MGVLLGKPKERFLGWNGAVMSIVTIRDTIFGTVYE